MVIYLADDKDIERIVNEYKMSMGGSFFSKRSDMDTNDRLEQLIIENVIKDHLFDIQELLLTYDKLSEVNKRELFIKVVIAFTKHEFNKK
jgi:hypothetical protein